MTLKKGSKKKASYKTLFYHDILRVERSGTCGPIEASGQQNFSIQNGEFVVHQRHGSSFARVSERRSGWSDAVQSNGNSRLGQSRNLVSRVSDRLQKTQSPTQTKKKKKTTCSNLIVRDDSDLQTHNQNCKNETRDCTHLDSSFVRIFQKLLHSVV